MSFGLEEEMSVVEVVGIAVKVEIEVVLVSIG
jgi:hypothetical protein